MEEIKSIEIHPDIWHLLSFATSEKNINQEYKSYIRSPARKLHGYFIGGESMGCIGIEFINQRAV
ncbi:hypothetical protein [Halobacillus sp. A5]|uniref:hypothetical protein n=1 Tax=Halobacillus sp. A5 TaxID=2880263 RepID=UPI0020A64E32|nr:hypothetical protein [Halobacillus sp. A5]MCP3029016.1 hypothetical protein [Halobacillus sp. A5]